MSGDVELALKPCKECPFPSDCPECPYKGDCCDTAHVIHMRVRSGDYERLKIVLLDICDLINFEHSTAVELRELDDRLAFSKRILARIGALDDPANPVWQDGTPKMTFPPKAGA